ncbi:hypothetical protein AB0M41_08360 [Streptomyces sp. NPDC051896]|uniref:hypothetical protein n=1 Tax=Streptomyces sp. NPDC051896 TaxID=3155416 RepID=UPI003433518F
MENPAHTAPLSLDDRIDQRITHILGKTVVPMFNALIETSGKHRKELVALRAGVQRIGRRLHNTMPGWSDSKGRETTDPPSES